MLMLRFVLFHSGLRFVEWGLDTKAKFVKISLWFKGLRERGWSGAFNAAAGLNM